VHSPNRENAEEEEFVLEALAKVMDDLPADALLVVFLDDGVLLSTSSHITEDVAYVPFYPSPPISLGTCLRYAAVTSPKWIGLGLWLT